MENNSQLFQKHPNNILKLNEKNNYNSRMILMTHALLKEKFHK